MTSSEFMSSMIVWDTETGKHLLDLAQDSRHMVRGVAVSPGWGERSSIPAGQDGTVRFWDAETGRAGMVLDGHEGVRSRSPSIRPAGQESGDFRPGWNRSRLERIERPIAGRLSRDHSI